MNENFDNLGLIPELLQTIKEIGYTIPTQIQNDAIPLVLQKQDFIGLAKTGSGKTAAFALPMIQRIIQERIKGLVLVPTRELALQVWEETVKFSKRVKINAVVVYGGASMDQQVFKLQQNPDIIIATPGRLLDHMRRRTVNLSQTAIVVLDEADRMFDMGFRDDIYQILSQTRRERQTMLFSATMNDEVIRLAKRYMKSTQKIGEETHIPLDKIKQIYYEVEREFKPHLLLRILQTENPSLAMIFCNRREDTERITEYLNKYGMNAVCLHAGMRQNKRQNVMEDFKQSKVNILVATDVAARGIDIKNVSHIINYDIHENPDNYLHRIGRTARAGETGKAITIIEPAEYRYITEIEYVIKRTMRKGNVDEFGPLLEVRFERHYQQNRSFQRQGQRYGQGGHRPSGHGGQSHGGGRPRFGGNRNRR